MLNSKFSQGFKMSAVLFLTLVFSSVIISPTVQAIGDPTPPLFSVGNGTPSNPWLIYNCTDLQSINNEPDHLVCEGNFLCGHYKVMNDVNCGSIANFVPLAIDKDNGFEGVFDGNNKTISNLYISTATDKTGLFSRLEGQDAIVMNINLRNGSVTSTSDGIGNVGSIVGFLYNYSRIIGSSSNLIVSGQNRVGGLVGSAAGSAKIIRSYFFGSVTCSVNYAGGLVGQIEDGGIYNSYANSSITAVDFAGGLVGWWKGNSNHIVNSYSQGSVVASDGTLGKAGGLVGKIDTGNAETDIANSFAVSSVSGEIQGGLYGDIGSISNFVQTNTYYDATSSGQNYAYDEVEGNQGELASWQNSTTSEPLDQWDFDNIWIANESDLPTLLTIDSFLITGIPSTPSSLLVEDIEDINYDGNLRDFNFSWTVAESLKSNLSTRYYYDVKRHTDEWPATPYSATSVTYAWVGAETASNIETIYGTQYDLRVRVEDAFGTSTWATTTYTTSPTPIVEINDCEDLQGIDSIITGNLESAYYDYEIGTSTIDCSEVNGDGIFNPIINSFRGVLDGNGVEIINLNIASSSNGTGIFSGAYDAVIKNLSLSGNPIVLTDTNNVGALIGNSGERITIQNVTSTISIVRSGDDVSSNSIGGLIGSYFNDKSNSLGLVIENSHVSSTISASTADSVGGLVGYFDSRGENFLHSISDSSFSGNLTGNTGTAGLIGDISITYSDELAIDTCSVDARITGGDYTGGLLGRLNLSSNPKLTIVNSHYDGTQINGRGEVGGLLGGWEISSSEYVKASSISKSYSTGKIVASGGNVGGLIGEWSDIYGCSDACTGTFVVSESYATGDVSGTESIGGLVGNIVDGNYSIINSYATGDVTGSGNVAGGLVGNISRQADTIYINKSYATGNVTGPDVLGGLVGQMNGRVSDSFSTGEVSSTLASPVHVAGFVGVMDDSSLDNNYWSNSLSNGVGDTSAELFIDNAYEKKTSAEYFQNTSTADPLSEWTFSGPGQIWVATAGNYPTLYNISADDPTLYTLTYSAGSGGSITGTVSQTVNYGSTGSAVTATANSGYRFVRWSDNSTSAVRSDLASTNKSFSATFEIIPSSGSLYVPPPSVGLGVVDAPIPMNTTSDIGTITNGGVNVLGYINTQANFVAPESSTGWQPNFHSLQITNLNLGTNIITIVLSSKPQTITLARGETRDVDLDGDGKNDIRVAFADLKINRAEVTVVSLAQATPIATPVENPNDPIICTMDVKECADGSYVGRSGANCEFVCPPVIIKPTAIVKPTKFIFKKDLKSGMVNNDVKELQKFLNANGFTIAKTGPGSKGKETTKFGAATRTALIKFQKAKKITPAIGIFGPATRKVVNAK